MLFGSDKLSFVIFAWGFKSSEINSRVPKWTYLFYYQKLPEKDTGLLTKNASWNWCMFGLLNNNYNRHFCLLCGPWRQHCSALHWQRWFIRSTIYFLMIFVLVISPTERCSFKLKDQVLKQTTALQKKSWITGLKWYWTKTSYKNSS